jgi:hypothetical protein
VIDLELSPSFGQDVATGGGESPLIAMDGSLLRPVEHAPPFADPALPEIDPTA